MSQRPVASTTNGRLNLEQQRKRAKELLPHLKREDPNATLSQAQWQIARGLGFSSWPKLKAHVDALDFATRHPDFIASDEARTTHWRCGNDIAHSLQVAGFTGQFQMLTDPLCMGPVRDLPGDDYQPLRGAFISHAFGLNETEVARRLADEYARLEHLATAQHSVLWCEADAYDQLFLIRALAGLERLPPKLELIESTAFPVWSGLSASANWRPMYSPGCGPSGAWWMRQRSNWPNRRGGRIATPHPCAGPNWHTASTVPCPCSRRRCCANCRNYPAPGMACP